MIMKEELVIVAQEEIAPRIFAMDDCGSVLAYSGSGCEQGLASADFDFSGGWGCEQVSDYLSD